MEDLLEQITAHEDAITRQWSQAIRLLPNSPYTALDDAALQAAIRRSAQSLLHVMRTGDTSTMEETLRASARRRREEGIGYTDNAAVWLLYRQVVQQVLSDKLSPDTWEQIVDRVDAVLDWVLRILHDTYRESPPVSSA